MWVCCNNNAVDNDKQYEKQVNQARKNFKDRLSYQQYKGPQQKNEQSSSKVVKKSLGAMRRKTEAVDHEEIRQIIISKVQTKPLIHQPPTIHKPSPVSNYNPNNEARYQSIPMSPTTPVFNYKKLPKPQPRIHQHHYIPPNSQKQNENKIQKKVPQPLKIYQSNKLLEPTKLKPQNKTQQNQSDHLQVCQNSFFLSSSRKLTELQFKHTQSVGDCSNLQSDISVVVETGKQPKLFLSHLISKQETVRKDKNNGTRGSQIGTDTERSPTKSPKKGRINKIY